jgi:hypothetical protein
MYCCGSRQVWPTKLYATFIAPNCSCLNGVSITLTYVNNAPFFRGYLTNWTSTLLQAAQMTSCYGVVNAPTDNPPITNCNIGPLGIVMSIVCLTNSAMELRTTLTNYQQTTEPTRCNASIPNSGYHGGPIGNLFPGSFSGPSGSTVTGIGTFTWDCDGPVIFKFSNLNNPVTYQDFFSSGGTIALTGCTSGSYEILVTE